MMGFPITQEATISALHAAAPPHTAAPPLLLASDNDAFFEYGYVWLPYAIAALALFGLGAVAAVRWRRSSPGTAELLITAGALLAVLAAIVLGLADGASEGNGLASIDPPVWQWMIDHRAPALTTIARPADRSRPGRCPRTPRRP